MSIRNTVSASLSVAAIVLGSQSAGCASFALPQAPRTFEEQSCVERALRRSPDPATVAIALAQFGEACANGAQAACSPLGVMYELGLATGKDPERAARLYLGACQAGNVGGCANLGLAYLYGSGVAPDAGRARTLLESSCAGQHPVACRELGTIFLVGQGAHIDLNRAGQHFQRACDLGDGDGCLRLGSLFERGVGVAVDAGRAFELYQEGCLRGQLEACDGIDRVQRHAAELRRSHIAVAVAERSRK